MATNRHKPRLRTYLLRARDGSEAIRIVAAPDPAGAYHQLGLLRRDWSIKDITRWTIKPYQIMTVTDEEETL